MSTLFRYNEAMEKASITSSPKRKPLPRKLEKEIYQQFQSRCPFCGVEDVATFQVHHIEPYATVEEHKAENLILLCANCHQKVEAGKISLREVLTAKVKAEIVWETAKEATPAGNTINVEGGNHGVIANTLTMASVKKTIKIAPPVGTIGSDFELRNYAKYLIDQYHEFKKAEMGKRRMNYTILYGNIKKEFGGKWDMLSVEKFERLTEYLKSRIDQTILGKVQKAKGYGNYSSFESHNAR